MDWIPNREAIQWFLERAWPKIHQSSPEFEFYFAGRKMPDEFKAMNIPGVHCLDEVPSAEDFIADKKILIVPIWTGGGIRVKILEAMAAGKVVITTSSGIKGIEAKAGKHFLLARKPEDFERAVKWCLEHKPEAETMAAKARELVKEKYEQGKVIGDIITELETLLAARKR
jgi:glycosyltransferase involved in cell wall biosynthesis